MQLTRALLESHKAELVNASQDLWNEYQQTLGGIRALDLLLKDMAEEAPDTTGDQGQKQEVQNG